MALRQQIGRVAGTDSAVLVIGETGSGKERVAEAIHRSSARREGPFVVLDCASVAPELIESELFGHVKGAYTDAAQGREGAFARAHRGTLFLDELGELALELQRKLLRVVETGTVRRVGSNREEQVDVRVVAATHRNLEAAVREQRFRQDLYYRLAVVELRVTPLRDRPEDLDLLVRHFLREQGRPAFELPANLLERLRSHTWPGNVRELRNVVERALAGVELDAILSTEMRQPIQSGDLTLMPFKEAKDTLVEAFTKEYLQALLERCGGNVSEIARTSGIARTYVHKLLSRYGMTAK